MVMTTTAEHMELVAVTTTNTMVVELVAMVISIEDMELVVITITIPFSIQYGRNHYSNWDFCNAKCIGKFPI